MTIAVMVAACSVNEDDLRRYAREGDVASLEAYVNEHYEDARPNSPRYFQTTGDSTRILLAIDLLIATPTPEAAQALQRLVVRSPFGGMGTITLERVNAFRRPLPYAVELFRAYAERTAESIPERPTRAIAHSLRLSATPEDWEAILRDVLTYLDDEKRQSSNEWEGLDQPRWLFDAKQLLLTYRAVAGPGADQIGEVIEAFDARMNLTESLGTVRRNRMRVQVAAESAETRHAEVRELMPGEYGPRRFFLVADLGQFSEGITLYEVAFPDPYYPGLPSEEHALLLTSGTFRSRGWATVLSSSLPSIPTRLREELGGFEQYWPAFAEVSQERIDELEAAGAELARANQALLEAQREEEGIDAQANSLLEQAKAHLLAMIEELEAR